MSTINTINEKLAIVGWEHYKTKRYGIKSCKPKYNFNHVENIRDMYLFIKEREECEETIPCNCSVEKLEEIINTL